MKIASVVASLLLTASVAVGQTYKVQSVTGGTMDVTTMTNTVNAWKYFAGNPVCAPKTLTAGPTDNSVWCIGANGGPPYMFDWNKKSWTPRNDMGTSPVYLVMGSSTNNYSLQNNSWCAANTPQTPYDLYYWNGSAWTQPHPNSCMSIASIDINGVLRVVGWDGNNHTTALYTSSDAGKSYQLWSDNWKYINMQAEGYEGCALANANSMWLVRTTPNSSPSQLPNLPSGTPAGCLHAEMPVVELAWNTAGQVYAMTEENYGTWKAVTGLVAGTIVGSQRFWIYGEDTSGKPYHWNTNAMGATAVFGGTWSSQNGCPSPGNICNPTTTHTVKNRVHFTSGHGIQGQQQSSTQVYTNNIEVSASDYNPLCDPFVGLSGDIECQMIEETDSVCNQSHEDLGKSADQYDWGVSTSILYWVQNAGGTDPQVYGSPAFGVYRATVASEAMPYCKNGITPTCAPIVDQKGDTPIGSNLSCAYADPAGYGACDEAIWDLYYLYLEGKPSPWVSYEPWWSKNGVVSCIPINLPLVPYWQIPPPVDCN